MEIRGKHTAGAARLFEMLGLSKGFKCSACNVIYDDVKMAAYVEGYKPRDPLMRKAVPLENVGAYVICEECARLPEQEVFQRAQQTLVRNGLLQVGHKPLDIKQGRRKRAPLIGQGTKFKFGTGR
jgi:hypothetical protein